MEVIWIQYKIKVVACCKSSKIIRVQHNVFDMEPNSKGSTRHNDIMSHDNRTMQHTNIPTLVFQLTILNSTLEKHLQQIQSKPIRNIIIDKKSHPVTIKQCSFNKPPLDLYHSINFYSYPNQYMLRHPEAIFNMLLDLLQKLKSSPAKYDFCHFTLRQYLEGMDMDYMDCNHN